MVNNKQIIISRANSHKATFWSTQKLLWSEFVEMLKTPVRGSETHQQFMQMTKAKQDELKDVGAFVGGELKDGRRKSGNVINRHLIALDLDNIPTGGTDEVLKRVGGLGCAYVAYSTRKHSSYKPRLRIIIPLVMPVSADKYEPIARKLATLIGLELTDPTTFEVNRLMYFPSCSSDSEYVYKFTDKPFLDGEAILAMYQNWQDISEWPRLDSEDKALVKLRAKAKNPLEKKGVVGAFCRTYNIIGAIEKFLPGIYEPTDTGDRLTYLEGSTVGGAVLYDDGNWLYSHHATDPCSMKLVNAFDLIRLHKFDDLDDNAKEGTPINRMPSYLEMIKFAKEDDLVAEAIRIEVVERAKNDFREAFSTSTENGVSGEDDLDWYSNIKLHEKTGKPLPNPENVITLLEGDVHLKGRIKKDEFNNQIIGTAPLPWSPRNNMTSSFIWSDDDDAGLRNYTSMRLGFRTENIIKDGFTEIYNRYKFHPAKAYVENLVWDGNPRVETIFINWLCAEDIPGYTRLASKQFLKAMVKRLYEPGCEYQEMIILVGEQGNFKSKLLSELAKGWYTSALDTMDTKVVGERTAGVWLVSLDELTLFARQSEEAKKEFISRRSEKYRPAYGKHAVEYPRSFVLTGTTNKTEILGDYTGDRRYLPIQCGSKDKIMANDPDNNFKLVVDQILAEAYVLYKQDSFIGIPRENWAIFDEVRENFRYENEYSEDVLTVLENEGYPKQISVEWLGGKIPILGARLSRKEKLKLHDAIQRIGKYERIAKSTTAFGKATRNGYRYKDWQ